MIDSTFADTIPSQQKQGLMKTMLSYVGIKSQDSLSSVNYASPAPPSTSMYNTPTSGMASGIHYMPPTSDIQNRKQA